MFGQVFLYPFKLFLHLEPYIRNRLLELESADRDRFKTETDVREKAIRFWENEGDVRYHIQRDVVRSLLTGL